MMTNAKQEFLHAVKDSSVVCAEIFYYTDGYHNEESEQRITLNTPHTEKDYEEFLSKLDFNYDAGYGTQYIFGTTWLLHKKTGASNWMTRGEYDGSEWWDVHRIPNIPEHLRNV